MVLPANLSERVQRIAKLQQRRPDLHQHTWNIHAVDAKSFMDYMNANSGELTRLKRSATAPTRVTID
jgi:hypothetical protein